MIFSTFGNKKKTEKTGMFRKNRIRIRS